MDIGKRCRGECWLTWWKKAWAVNGRMYRRSLPITCGCHWRKPQSTNCLLNVLSGQRIMADRPIYGLPLLQGPLTFAPTNEAGVLAAFACHARELGFTI